jgi:hypothetical protein
MGESLTPFALFSLFLGAGLQIYGYTNPIIGIILLLLSLLFLGFWAWGYVNKQRTADNRAPFVLNRAHFRAISQFIGTLSIGALSLFAAEIFFGFSPLPEKLITVAIPAPPDTMPLIPAPLQLVANNPPPTSNDIAVNASRFLLLSDMIEKTETVRGTLMKTAEAVLDAQLEKIEMEQKIKEGKAPTMLGIGSILGLNRIYSWRDAVGELEDINKKVYSNRPIDTTTTRKLSIPTMVAPGEEKFIGNDEATNTKKYEFRKFYFLSQNVVQQASAFIEDMQKDKVILVQELEKTAEGKKFMGAKK